MPRLALLTLLVVTATPALGWLKKGGRPQPTRAATLSEVVAVGTVVNVEPEPTRAKPQASAADDVAYTVTVVKIETPLIGARNLTHVRVGTPRGQVTFLPDEGKVLMFLRPHQVANFLVASPHHSPLDLSKDGAAQTLKTVEAVAATVNDPMKALSAERKDDRVAAAAILAERYRKLSRGLDGSEEVDRPADESKLLFAALAEADWSAALPDGLTILSHMHALDLGPQGYALAPTVDASKERFVKWLADEGKSARVKQFVVRK